MFKISYKRTTFKLKDIAIGTMFAFDNDTSRPFMRVIAYKEINDGIVEVVDLNSGEVHTRNGDAVVRLFKECDIELEFE